MRLVQRGATAIPRCARGIFSETPEVARPGSGSGIGKAIAKMFLTFGAKVYIGSRKKERLEEALKELKPLGYCDFVELNIAK